MGGKVTEALLLWLCFTVLECSCLSSPGKPSLTGCRSPEKETFTCWWEPGSDGGLPTTYRLYYQREDLEGTRECPDYTSAGRNSCFFDKNHTFIWVNYNLTVVATNALGSTTSDSLQVDVMYVVQPNIPENVTVLVDQTKGNHLLLIRWEPPSETDTRSGWVTISYQLRVKREHDREWEEYFSDKRTEFTIYSVHPGMYMVQVRCKLDHSFWSMWSSTTYREVPDNAQKKKPTRILVSIFSALALTAAMWTFVKKRKRMKLCLLPPVPAPKIRGFDIKLIKPGCSEDIFGPLTINQSSLSMAANMHKMEEFLLVFDSEECALLDAVTTQDRKGLIIPSGLQLHLEAISSETRKNDDGAYTTEKTECRVDISKSCKSTCMKNLLTTKQSEVTQEQPILRENISYTQGKGMCSTDQTTEDIAGSTDNGYVDTRQHKENLQGLDVTQDYSRVIELNCDNVLFLQRPTALISSQPCKALTDHVQGTSQKRPQLPVIELSKGAHASGEPSGYVDTMASLMTL